MGHGAAGAWRHRHALSVVVERERTAGRVSVQAALQHVSLLDDVDHQRRRGRALVDATSYGPPLSRTNVEGEDRERAVRRLISEGSATMPAFRYALRPEQIDSIIGYLKRVETLRLPVVDRLVELSSPSLADPVSFGETAGPLWGTVTSTSGERLEGVTVSARAPGRR